MAALGRLGGGRRSGRRSDGRDASGPGHGHRPRSRRRRPAAAGRRCAARPAGRHRRLLAELAGEPGDTVPLAQEDARPPAAARPSSANVGACRSGASSVPCIGTMSSDEADDPGAPGRSAPAPASRRRAADARPGRGRARHRPATEDCDGMRRRPRAREAARYSAGRSRPAPLRSPGRTADIRRRKAGGGRGPRQPGQVRKEAAVTGFAPGRRPVFRLARPSGRWSRSCSAPPTTGSSPAPTGPPGSRR